MNEHLTLLRCCYSLIPDPSPLGEGSTYGGQEVFLCDSSISITFYYAFMYFAVNQSAIHGAKQYPV